MQQQASPIATLKGSFVLRAKVAFMAAGLAALILSVSLWFTGSRDEAVFVGLWVPAIHSLGALVLAPERIDNA